MLRGARAAPDRETVPQLIFLAYLHSVVNGSGFVDCEYGLGWGRVDVCVRKACTGADGKPAVQREVVELKVRRQGRGNPLKAGLHQLDSYLEQLGVETGCLVVFDRRPGAQRKRTERSVASSEACRVVRGQDRAGPR